MADTGDSKSPARKGMRVRLPPPAPIHQSTREETLGENPGGSLFREGDSGMCSIAGTLRAWAGRHAACIQRRRCLYRPGDCRVLEIDPTVDLNARSALRLSEPNIARLFERQVRRTPHSLAVAFEKERLSYRELDARSNRLAHALRALGVGPGVLVGISMERSLETPLGVLGILKAGGAYVALDPEYPRERLEFMLEDSRAPVLLTDEATVLRIPRHDAVRVVLGSEPARVMLAAQADTPLAAGAAPEDLAYVIYTSGSTGRPKGVAMPHRALLNLIAWQRDAALNPAAK